MADKSSEAVIGQTARRLKFYNEFKIRCMALDVPVHQGLREAIFQWVEEHQDVIRRIYDYLPKDKRKDLWSVFKAVAYDLEKTQRQAVGIAIRNWLDNQRREYYE